MAVGGRASRPVRDFGRIEGPEEGDRGVFWVVDAERGFEVEFGVDVEDLRVCLLLVEGIRVLLGEWPS